jgi:hypothetical protein
MNQRESLTAKWTAGVQRMANHNVVSNSASATATAASEKQKRILEQLQEKKRQLQQNLPGASTSNSNALLKRPPAQPAQHLQAPPYKAQVVPY